MASYQKRTREMKNKNSIFLLIKIEIDLLLNPYFEQNKHKTGMCCHFQRQFNSGRNTESQISVLSRHS